MTSSTPRGVGGGVTHCRKTTPSFSAESSKFRKFLEMILKQTRIIKFQMLTQFLFFGFVTFDFFGAHTLNSCSLRFAVSTSKREWVHIGSGYRQLSVGQLLNVILSSKYLHHCKLWQTIYLSPFTNWNNLKCFVQHRIFSEHFV